MGSESSSRGRLHPPIDHESLPSGHPPATLPFFHTLFFFFLFITLGLELSDAKVYEP